MDVTRSGVLLKIAGATKANVVIRIPRSVIQIRRESPSVARVIPITTADESVLRFDLSFPFSLYFSSYSHPTCEHFSNFIEFFSTH